MMATMMARVATYHMTTREVVCPLENGSIEEDDSPGGQGII